MPVVRLSRGSFPREAYEQVHARLLASADTLVPAIRALPGCLHYWAAIDAASNTMVNVCVWATLAEAQQMNALAPMIALAAEFVSLGVAFERPITNSETVWQV